MSGAPSASAISATDTTPRDRMLSAMSRLRSTASIRQMVPHRSYSSNTDQKERSRVDKIDRNCIFPVCLRPNVHVAAASRHERPGLIDAGGGVLWVTHG